MMELKANGDAWSAEISIRGVMMELKVRTSQENYIELELVGEDIAFADAIREILIQNKDVEFAASKKEHPQVSSPVIYLRTKSKNPLDLLLKAVSELKEKTDEFHDALKGAKKPK